MAQRGRPKKQTAKYSAVMLAKHDGDFSMVVLHMEGNRVVSKEVSDADKVWLLEGKIANFIAMQHTELLTSRNPTKVSDLNLIDLEEELLSED